MTKYFVFYDDDRDIDCGARITSFDTKEEVEKFINERLNEDCQRYLKDYKVIYGEKLKLIPEEKITKIKIYE